MLNRPPHPPISKLGRILLAIDFGRVPPRFEECAPLFSPTEPGIVLNIATHPAKRAAEGAAAVRLEGVGRDAVQVAAAPREDRFHVAFGNFDTHRGQLYRGAAIASKGLTCAAR
jgi:hypothetical protein